MFKISPNQHVNVSRPFFNVIVFFQVFTPSVVIKSVMWLHNGESTPRWWHSIGHQSRGDVNRRSWIARTNSSVSFVNNPWTTGSNRLVGLHYLWTTFLCHRTSEDANSTRSKEQAHVCEQPSLENIVWIPQIVEFFRLAYLLDVILKCILSYMECLVHLESEEKDRI